MGESPATYEHADAVKELTQRIRAEHPAALVATLECAPALIDAIDESNRTRSYDPLTIFVAVFQHLTTCILSHLPDAATVANEIITAALYEANGIDWAATSVQVTQPQPGTYRLRFSSGSGSSSGTVPAPRPGDRHPFSPDPHLDTEPLPTDEAVW